MGGNVAAPVIEGFRAAGFVQAPVSQRIQRAQGGFVGGRAGVGRHHGKGGRVTDRRNLDDVVEDHIVTAGIGKGHVRQGEAVSVDAGDSPAIGEIQSLGAPLITQRQVPRPEDIEARGTAFVKCQGRGRPHNRGRQQPHVKAFFVIEIKLLIGQRARKDGHLVNHPGESAVLRRIRRAGIIPNAGQPLESAGGVGDRIGGGVLARAVVNVKRGTVGADHTRDERPLVGGNDQSGSKVIGVATVIPCVAQRVIGAVAQATNIVIRGPAEKDAGVGRDGGSSGIHPRTQGHGIRFHKERRGHDP
ncbi:MAG: hypothetical protein BWX84_01727 [Verrucomicrobia bacterium ADurb.Bin118]|nr:MAG: hypothetical protein BWX84_01727 [Verrucomicrobia bacterium ADurb.Bin118]